MKRVWGVLSDGREATEYVIGKGNIRAEISDLGATLLALHTPDRNGTPGNILLRYQTAAEYEAALDYLGATVGRYANRIGGARFFLNGKEYRLTKNENDNCLHGGDGVHKKLWMCLEADDTHVVLGYESPDGADGFPGRLSMKVTYRITEEEALEICHEAVSDRDTFVSMTCHPYFDLSGNGVISDCLLQIAAREYTPVDESLIPDGRLLPVNGTPFDYLAPRQIGEQALDNNFVLLPGEGPGACLLHPTSGRKVEIYTDLPGLQVYTADCLRSGRSRSGIAIEPQFFPNAPNQPEFPSPLLRAGDRYRHTIRFCPGIA